MKRIILVFVRRLCRLFFSEEYLRGRWFEGTNLGWVWTLKGVWFQKVLGFNRKVPWPIHPSSKISNTENIEFHPDNLDNFQSFGCYYQNFSAKIRIGRGVYIAPNVGIITANHSPDNPEEQLEGKDVEIGDASWIGMNSVILPGVVLGPGTVVGAGSVVTKSFREGKCVLGGVPARVLREL